MLASKNQGIDLRVSLGGSCPVVLAVGAIPLRQMAVSFGWGCFESATCAGAVTFLKRKPVPVVVCDQNLPDGDWKILLEEIGKLGSPPTLIVTSWFADDRLWGEVLNLGAYDLLLLPFDAEEVRRVVALAWEANCRESKKYLNGKALPPAARSADAG